MQEYRKKWREWLHLKFEKRFEKTIHYICMFNFIHTFGVNHNWISLNNIKWYWNTWNSPIFHIVLILVNVLNRNIIWPQTIKNIPDLEFQKWYCYTTNDHNKKTCTFRYVQKPLKCQKSIIDCKHLKLLKGKFIITYQNLIVG